MRFVKINFLLFAIVMAWHSRIKLAEQGITLSYSSIIYLFSSGACSANFCIFVLSLQYVVICCNAVQPGACVGDFKPYISNLIHLLGI